VQSNERTYEKFTCDHVVHAVALFAVELPLSIARRCSIASSPLSGNVASDFREGSAPLWSRYLSKSNTARWKPCDEIPNAKWWRAEIANARARCTWEIVRRKSAGFIHEGELNGGLNDWINEETVKSIGRIRVLVLLLRIDRERASRTCTRHASITVSSLNRISNFECISWTTVGSGRGVVNWNARRNQLFRGGCVTLPFSFHSRKSHTIIYIYIYTYRYTVYIASGRCPDWFGEERSDPDERTISDLPRESLLGNRLEGFPFPLRFATRCLHRGVRFGWTLSDFQSETALPHNP
jgi:hypothetical protein